MKNFWFVFILTIFVSYRSVSVTHTIINSGFSFSPSTLTINLGDTVKFVLATIHNAREVSQTTWNANGTTSNGGFETPFGGGTVVLQQTGTHYYVCVNHAFMGMKGQIVVNTSSDVQTSNNNVPSSFDLSQNFPNPFNPSTKISFSLPQKSNFTLKIYNAIGQEIKTLVNGEADAGIHEIEFNGSNLASGIYFYRLSTPGFTDTKRLVLLK
jgi:plastocyanin